MWKLKRIRHLSTQSRLGYFAQLLYLNRWTRDATILLGIPIILAVVAIMLLENASNRERLSVLLNGAMTAYDTSRDYSLDNAVISGASPEVGHQIEKLLADFRELTTVRMPVEQIRSSLLTLSPVRDASVRVRNDGRLNIRIVEKLPVLIWHIDGKYVLIDKHGDRLRSLEDRNAHPELQLVSGPGAAARVEEALEIYNVSWDLSQMTRGLVRVGQRRWDIILDRDRIIMLPETDPVEALNLLDVVEDSGEILSRDLAVIDLRNPGHMVVRIRSDNT